jgi:hypothetical protein
MGIAAYGDWRSDAPGVRRKITPADLPPSYATASANNAPTVVERPLMPGRKRRQGLSSSLWPPVSTTRA